MNCSACNAVVHWDADRCPKCQFDVGAPNVRLVNVPEEKAALLVRFENATTDAKTRGAEDAVQKFKDAIMISSRAVVNVNADFVWSFLREKRSLYVGYEMLVASKIRKPASFNDDRRRRSVDALIHGSLGEQITSAALSIDGRGLRSYGVAALGIAKQTTIKNASLLEQNAYDFVTSHHLLPDDPLPLGYRCIWTDRSILAVAKLARRINRATNEKAFPGVLLKSGRNRLHDEFIEVHIWGPFDWQAIDTISVGNTHKLGDEERQMLKNTHDLAKQANISWREE